MLTFFMFVTFAEPTKPMDLKAYMTSPTKIKLEWNEAQMQNGPLTGYEIHYRPSDVPSLYSINKSVLEPSVDLSINCSAYNEAVTFIFEVFSSTGMSEDDKLFGDSVWIEKDMCGPGFSSKSNRNLFSEMIILKNCF